jgi:hypothetical protein
MALIIFSQDEKPRGVLVAQDAQSVAKALHDADGFAPLQLPHGDNNWVYVNPATVWYVRD